MSHYCAMCGVTSSSLKVTDVFKFRHKCEIKQLKKIEHNNEYVLSLNLGVSFAGT